MTASRRAYRQPEAGYAEFSRRQESSGYGKREAESGTIAPPDAVDTRIRVEASTAEGERDWLTFSPIVEVSNMPHADTAGVRLLAETGLALGAGLRATVRGGYQARSFDQGGPTIGGGLAYAF